MTSYHIYRKYCPHCNRLMMTQALAPPTFYCQPCAYQLVVHFREDTFPAPPSWMTQSPWETPWFKTIPPEHTEIPAGILRAFAYDDLMEQGYDGEVGYEEEGA